jgi:hypothetical protein
VTSFADESILSRYEKAEDNSSGAAMTVKRKVGRFTAILPPSCHACYRPITAAPKRNPQAEYCEACEESGKARWHRQMTGRMR